MAEVPLKSSLLREGPVARVWAFVLTLSLFAVLPFVYASLWPATFAGAAGGLGSAHSTQKVWLVFAALQVANKVPIAYRYTAGPAGAAFDLLGFCAGLVAVVVLGAGVPVPTGAVRVIWFLVVAGWLVASVWHQLNPHVPQNRGMAPWHRMYCAFVATLVPGLPLVLAVLAAPAA